MGPSTNLHQLFCEKNIVAVVGSQLMQSTDHCNQQLVHATLLLLLVARAQGCQSKILRSGGVSEDVFLHRSQRGTETGLVCLVPLMVARITAKIPNSRGLSASIRALNEFRSLPTETPSTGNGRRRPGSQHRLAAADVILGRVHTKLGRSISPPTIGRHLFPLSPPTPCLDVSVYDLGPVRVGRHGRFVDARRRFCRNYCRSICCSVLACTSFPLLKIPTLMGQVHPTHEPVPSNQADMCADKLEARDSYPIVLEQQR